MTLTVVGITHSILVSVPSAIRESFGVAHRGWTVSHSVKSLCILVDCRWSAGGSRSLHHSHYRFKRAGVACTVTSIEANSPKKSLGMAKAV